MGYVDGYREVLELFQRRSGDAEVEDHNFEQRLCAQLMKASSALQASIWRVTDAGELKLGYGTNIQAKDLEGIYIRVGEGISGSVALARQPFSVTDAWSLDMHDKRVDQKVGFRTSSMVSAPIVFNGTLYGVINLLNHASGRGFSFEWTERLCSVATLYGAHLSLSDASDERIVITSSDGEGMALVGSGATMSLVLSQCYEAAHNMKPVYIQGEEGTGKSLVAQRIHELSEGRIGDFLEINCDGYEDDELVRILFTKPIRRKWSGIENGTLLISNIDQLDCDAQEKLYQVLRDNGKAKGVLSADVRLLVGTSVDLLGLVENGGFHKDLYYLLCASHIILPPLRERKGDLFLLTEYFLKQIHSVHSSRVISGSPIVFEPSVVAAMTSYSWPGNVTELRQVVASAMAVNNGPRRVKLTDLPTVIQDCVADAGGSESSEFQFRFNSTEGKREIRDNSYEHYMQVLEDTKYTATGRWNFASAARVLNIPRKTLTYQLKKLAIIN